MSVIPLASRKSLNVRERSRELGVELRKYVLNRIATGQLKPGDKLPTERELTEMFGGGRGSVRQALMALENEGLIAREVGRGTFVREAAAAASAPRPLLAPAAEPDHSVPLDMASIARMASPSDVMELRMMIEPAVIEQAVLRASQSEIERMYDYLKQATHAKTLEEFEHWDDMLHRAFALASRNPLFVAVYAMIGAVRLEAQWGEMKRRTLTDAAKAKVFDEHVAIVEAVRNRDAAGARREMQHHLGEIKKNMFGG
ncbi:FCD domain-containing protein [Variovorax defluvii]|uniref:FCD domain-containing protein n=1 Tax=Variovorax defluvii TaxID=913761 RepID=A0ABP8I183_9BURK